MDDRFFFVYIQRSAGDFPVLQRRDQRRLVHHRPARGVDEKRRPLHALEFRRIEKPVCLRQQRRVHADEVRLRQQLMHVPILRPQLFLCVPRRAHRVRVDDPHLKAAGPSSHRSSNAPEAHNPQRFSPHVRPYKLVQIPSFPVSRARQHVAFAQPPRHRHHQRPCKIRGRFVQHARSVGRYYSALRARWHVNIVVSHRHVRRNPQFWGSL